MYPWVDVLCLVEPSLPIYIHTHVTAFDKYNLAHLKINRIHDMPMLKNYLAVYIDVQDQLTSESSHKDMHMNGFIYVISGACKYSTMCVLLRRKRRVVTLIAIVSHIIYDMVLCKTHQYLYI